ncbi:MAG: hypothetical protein M1402_02020 [Candidatus Thermoplasmatota archaeon]|nr:hypothetical protein [Candidatus Thermoplasmatota archaeon]MCL5665535.1 hypothetical protein [Candidatus Thermoplasmatota archaeon]
MTSCPVCGERFEIGDYNSLASHFNRNINKNDLSHIDWIRSNVPMADYESDTFVERLKAYFEIKPGKLSDWIWKRLIDKFFGEKPNPFIESMQRPKKVTFMGYSMENYPYVKQRVKSFAYVIAKTDSDDVQSYEAELISHDLVYNGKSNASNIALLLNMAESVGLPKETVMNTMPLPPTLHAIKLWNSIAETGHWLEIMASMNLLDLVYSPRVTEMGGKISFYGKGVIDNEWIPDEVKAYLKLSRDVTGKNADVALELVEKYSEDLNMVEIVQATFLRSIDALERHLQARATRIKQFEAR